MAAVRDERATRFLSMKDRSQPKAVPQLMTQIGDSRPSPRGSRTGKIGTRAVIGVQHLNGCFGGPVNTVVSAGATSSKKKSNPLTNPVNSAHSTRPAA